MASTIPHNKFIFIMTSEPLILSLNFFYRLFLFKIEHFRQKKCMYNAMGKILKLTIVHFWYHIWFLHIISP